MPRRIQRSRTKGWRMPEGAVYVGRPTRWGNPFVLGSPEVGRRPDGSEWSIDDVLRWYRLWALNEMRDPDWIAPLRGLDLACWCPLDWPCHADVLLWLLNREPES